MNVRPLQAIEPMRALETTREARGFALVLAVPRAQCSLGTLQCRRRVTLPVFQSASTRNIPLNCSNFVYGVKTPGGILSFIHICRSIGIVEMMERI